MKFGVAVEIPSTTSEQFPRRWQLDRPGHSPIDI